MDQEGALKVGHQTRFQCTQSVEKSRLIHSAYLFSLCFGMRCQTVVCRGWYEHLEVINTSNVSS